MLKVNSIKLALISLFCCTLIGQSYSQDVRGLYVNDFKHIIGNKAKENELLRYAQQEGFNYLLLYNFYHIHNQLFNLTQVSTAAPLARFIKRAKTQFGVLEIGAVGETFQSFEVIDGFNQLYNDPMKSIDVYNLEYEFWNSSTAENYYCDAYLSDLGIDCTVDGSFEFYISELQKINELAKARGVKAETYIGLPTDEQSEQIGESCDRVLVHFYRTSDVYNNGNSIYNFKSARLPALAPEEGQLSILPIFASRSYFMGPWLTEHPQEQAFETFLYGQNGYEDAEGDWKAHLKIEGYQWYRYTDMLAYTQPSSGDLNLSASAIQGNQALATAANYRLPDTKYSLEKLAALKNALARVKPYPNPSDDYFIIQTTNLKGAELALFNIAGQRMRHLTIGEQETESISTIDLREGVYFLRLSAGEHQVVRKVVVVHL